MSQKTKYAITLSTIFLGLIFFSVLGLYLFQRGRINQLESEGFYPLNKVMTTSGYKETEENTYLKQVGNKEIRVTFDFNNNTCSKENFSFSLADNILKENLNGESYFLSKKKLEEIIGENVNIENGKVTISSKVQNQGDWMTNLPALVAHAGGAYRDANFNSLYTNSLEAIVQNYNLGHRVFEIDFYPTSDGDVAAVHDWIQFGDQNGRAYSSEEWKASSTYGSPLTPGRFSTLLAGDILDLMLVNPDMVIVTDTKATEMPPEQAQAVFAKIVEEANKRDPELLKRIVPQIYNEEIYNLLMNVYPFENVIYTAYATPSTGEEIVNFASQTDNIKTLTVPVSDVGRFNQSVIDLAHQNGLKIYSHTSNNYDNITTEKNRNIDGIYTDLLLPSDLEVFEEIAN